MNNSVDGEVTDRPIVPQCREGCCR